ncbi:unnamed protein product, partial [Effrenium voratum]
HFPKTGVRGNPWRLRPFDKWRRPNQGSVRRHSMSFCLMRSRRHRQDWSLHKAVHGNRLLAMPLDQHVAFRRCGLALRLQACIEPLILRALEAFGSKRLHSPNAQLALMLRLLCVLALGLAPVFLTPNSTSPTPRPEAPARTKATTPGPAPAHGDASSEDNGRVPHMLRVAAASLLALLVALVPLSAEAARSGGRMGGRSSAPRSAFRAAPRPRAVPRSEPHFGGPNVSIGIGPPVMPLGRYGGFGPGFGFGGFGYGVPLPLPLPGQALGPSANDQMLQNQQIQDERKLDDQNREIADLKKQIEELQRQPNAK